MKLICTLLELEQANLLKKVFVLKGWTIDSIEDALESDSPPNTTRRILVDYVFEVELPDTEEIRRYTKTIPFLLETETVELDEDMRNELGIIIVLATVVRDVCDYQEA